MLDFIGAKIIIEFYKFYNILYIFLVKVCIFHLCRPLSIKKEVKLDANGYSKFGMLTDSRSFSSYVRFDFFRRILSDYVGDLVDKGEYDAESAEVLVQNICYYNAKRMVE